MLRQSRQKARKRLCVRASERARERKQEKNSTRECQVPAKNVRRRPTCKALLSMQLFLSVTRFENPWEELPTALYGGGGSWKASGGWSKVLYTHTYTYIHICLSRSVSRGLQSLGSLLLSLSLSLTSHSLSLSLSLSLSSLSSSLSFPLLSLFSLPTSISLPFPPAPTFAFLSRLKGERRERRQGRGQD